MLFTITKILFIITGIWGTAYFTILVRDAINDLWQSKRIERISIMENKFDIIKDTNGNVEVLTFPFSKTQIQLFYNNDTDITHYRELGYMKIMDEKAPISDFNDIMYKDSFPYNISQYWIKQIEILTKEGKEILIVFDKEEKQDKKFQNEFDIIYVYKDKAIYPQIISSLTRRSFPDIIAYNIIFETPDDKHIYSESLLGHEFYRSYEKIIIG